MTQEQKDLLIKDLCARLPYGVKFNFKYGEYSSEIMRAIYLQDYVIISSKENSCEINDIKPYLFPISSMTEEQKEEHKDLLDNQYSFDANGNVFTLHDFYCKYHIDYRGLIPMGLAINATGLNIY